MPDAVAAAVDKGAFAREVAADPVLAASFAYCRGVARRRARNFYYGLRLTPEPHRSAMYAMYAFMRACDDLADSDGGSPAKGASRIEEFRAQMQVVLADGRLPETGGTTGDFWPAFREVARRFPVPPSCLHAMLDGQKADLANPRYATFAELRQYCYNVASVVGLVGISIWGYRGGEATRQKAEQRGIALQLTNILRDLGEDADRGRLYLPLDELAAVGMDARELLAHLQARHEPKGLERVLAAQAARAEEYFSQSSSLEEDVGGPGQAACWAIGRIYQGLLRKISRQPLIVLRRRVRLSSWHKAAIAVRALARARRL